MMFEVCVGAQSVAGDRQRCDLFLPSKVEKEVYGSGPQQEADEVVTLDNLRRF